MGAKLVLLAQVMVWMVCAYQLARNPKVQVYCEAQRRTRRARRSSPKR